MWRFIYTRSLCTCIHVRPNLSLIFQGRPGEKGEPGLTVSTVTDSKDHDILILTLQTYILCALLFFCTQREEVIRIIREICGKLHIFVTLCSSLLLNH